MAEQKFFSYLQQIRRKNIGMREISSRAVKPLWDSRQDLYFRLIAIPESGRVHQHYVSSILGHVSVGGDIRGMWFFR